MYNRRDSVEAKEVVWTPKTKLGKEVASGKITDIDDIFAKGLKIKEPGIVDLLLPNLEHETLAIGGSKGKGGGTMRTPFRRTARMHKSGRRFRISAMVVIGNANGYVGVGIASGPAGKQREVISKALNSAKLNIMPVSRGCGSWECKCGTSHSLPIEVVGKAGSVKVKLIPAPKGIGLAVSDEAKKILRLAGYADVWCRSEGQTSSRINFANAIYDALKKINTFRYSDAYKKAVYLHIGKGGLQ